MGANSISYVSNNISNKTVNKGDLDTLNNNVAIFVSNSIIKNTNECGTVSTQINENQGDITVVGKKTPANIGLNSQDFLISLECIQQSIQQTNINNDIATAIIENLTQSISNQQLTNIVNEAETMMKRGGILNPFSGSNPEVNINLSNIQITDTTRKLSNLISNIVANNQNVPAVKDCFTQVAQQQNNRVGNVKILGDENTNINISANQYAKLIATCPQLTQQIATTTNTIATIFGLKIVDNQIMKGESFGTTSSIACPTVVCPAVACPSCPVHNCQDPYNVCPEKLFVKQECPETIYIPQECPKQVCPKQKDNSAWQISVYILGGLLFICIIIVLILLLRKKKNN